MPSFNFGKKTLVDSKAAQSPAPAKNPALEKKAAVVLKAGAPAKPAPAKAIIGLGLIILAFVGVVVIMYLMMQTIMKKEADIGKLDDMVTQLQQERDIVQAEVDHLKAQGDSIKLDKLVAVANAFYDDKEKSRKDGLVWMNRKSKTYVATLGAIHGLKAGSKLAVFDGGNKIGTLQVETPYDVISFCAPVNSFQDSANKSYYRIVIE